MAVKNNTLESIEGLLENDKQKERTYLLGKPHHNQEIVWPDHAAGRKMWGVDQLAAASFTAILPINKQHFWAFFSKWGIIAWTYIQ